MTDPADTLIAAEARAALARERLSGTVADIQARLDPQSLVDDAKQAGSATVEAAKRNPAIVAGMAGATVLLLTRKRIARLLRRKPKPLPAQPRSSS